MLISYVKAFVQIDFDKFLVKIVDALFIKRWIV